MSQPNLSWWERQTFFGPADVVIVGAGLVGLTAAIYTKQLRPDWRVTVLERGLLPAGASTKNAGFACFGSVSELREQEKRGDLLRVVEARWEGLRRLRELVGDLTMRYEPVGNYELFRDTPAEAALADACLDQLAYYNELLAPVLGTSRIYHDATYRLRDFGCRGVRTVIANVHEGALDTGRMMAALLRLAWEAGVVVLTGCPVTALETEPDGTTTVRTPTADLRAAQVLLATNAFASELVPELAIAPGRGQVLVTEPVPGWTLPGPCHYDYGYTYFRALPDGRLLLGGGRNLDFAAEATTTPGTTDQVQAYLETLLEEVILPDHRPAIAARWSGVMAFGPELEPIIGFARPGVLAAVRCNGMGVAMGAGTGWKAALLLTQ